MKFKYFLSLLFLIFLFTNISAELINYPVDSEFVLFQSKINFENINDLDAVMDIAYELTYFIIDDYGKLMYEEIYGFETNTDDLSYNLPDPSMCLSQEELSIISNRYLAYIEYENQILDIKKQVNDMLDVDSEEIIYRYLNEASRRKDILNSLYDYSYILNSFMYDFVKEDENIFYEIGKAHVNDLNYEENCSGIYYYSDLERLVNNYNNFQSNDYSKSTFEDILNNNSNLDYVNILTYLKNSESDYQNKYLKPLTKLAEIPYECNLDSNKGVCKDLVIPKYIEIENFKEHNLIDFEYSDFGNFKNIDLEDVWEYIDNGYSIINVIEESGINKSLITSVKVIPENVPIQEDDSLYYSFSYKKEFKIFGIKLFSYNKNVKIDIQTKEFI